MIYSVFKKALTQNPETLAIVTSQGLTYTYAQVEAKVRKLASFWVKEGVQSGSCLAVLLNDEDNHVFIYLALDLLGAAYLPFDLDTPEQYIQQAIQTINVTKILTDRDNLPFNQQIQLRDVSDYDL